MSGYRSLEVWKLSIDLIESVYLLTKDFPKEEIYGLRSQMRRAAVSISANIAEGSGRGTRKDFMQFLSIAYGSCCEMETFCVVCHRLGLLSAKEMEKLETQIASISRMLKALRKSLKT